MISFKKYILFYLLFLLNGTISSQPTLYGIKNTAQVYKFASIDCTNDSVTEYARIPLNFYTSYFSSCYDSESKIYYYCTGQKMFVIDVLTGAITDTLDFSAIHPAYLHHIVFNPKDGFIYGIKVDNATLLEHFTRYDPATNQLTDIASLSGVYVGIGCKSAIDALKQEYIVQSTYIAAIDISSGNVIYNIPIQNVTDETVDHIAYSCKMQTIFGLSNNPHVPENYLSIIDTVSAAVSHVHPSPLPVYYYKHYLGGSSIDNTTDIFYYPAVGGKIYGVDIHSGNVVYSHDYGPGFEFLFIESASEYDCPILAINESDEINRLNIFPNPARNILYITHGIFEKFEAINIINSIGQIQKAEYSSVKNGEYVEVNIALLSPGIYFLELLTRKQKVVKKFIKN